MKHNRVLVFSTDDHLYPAGGAEQAFGNITERLPHVTFDLICARLRPHTPRKEVVRNVHIHRLGVGFPIFDKIVLALFGHWYAQRCMRRYSYDLVWSIMASYGAFSASRIKKKNGIPFLLTLQEGDTFEHIYRRVRYVRKAFNAIFECADGVQAISRYLLRWGKEMGFVGSVGKVIPNGVDIDRFMYPYRDVEIIKKRVSFGFPQDAFVCITSSRLEIKNGIADVIDALKLLPVNVCFVICGSGSLESKIREKVMRHHLERRVFFAGFVKPEDLPLFLNASDVFIRPSLSEGLGNAFLEAMAAEIITLGTDVGGIPDFLKDGETGFIVGVKNPQSIAEVVERVMGLDDATRSDIRKRAKNMVRDRYNWDDIAHDMELLFNEVTRVCTP
ncbi:MAG TPA: glycosyltransferase [Candidatus Paceibacterota bacterium]|nr:glycosyltransferase [Candidatus Paceibacterota bacterium]